MSASADLLARLALHPPRKCESPGCEHGEIAPRIGHLDQSTFKLDAAIYACDCGWERVEPLRSKPC